MPYDIRKIGDEYCVVKRSDNKTMGCHDTRDEAVRQLSAIEASEGSKATVFKYADGQRYMLLVTSNAYQDREDEWITTDALKAYVDSQWRGEQFDGDNVLLFWHDGPPIGDCVFADMEGPFLFEVFRERASGWPMIQHYAKAIWDYVEATPDVDWGSSHGFQYNPTETERDGGRVYRSIQKFESTIVPREYAANGLTYSGVIHMTDKARNEALERIVPGWGDKIRQALGLAKTELDEAGAEHKALKAKLQTTLTRDDLLDVLTAMTKSTIQAVATKAADAEDDQGVDVRDVAGDVLDTFLEVPTVSVEVAADILQVEAEGSNEAAANDAPAGDDHQHGDVLETLEPSELEKTLVKLIGFNDELISNQKALAEGIGVLPELVQALKAVAGIPQQLSALEKTVKTLQAEFAQRPRASRATVTEIAEQALKDAKEPLMLFGREVPQPTDDNGNS